ncbi:MAG TPA: metallopeptidase family protein [Longimicrobiales bacterium]
MNYLEFEQSAQEVWQQIPPQFKAGVDGLMVEQDAHTHPDHDEFFTLGECITETYPSEYGGPDTIRSAVVLYYGSFRAIALEDADFDWRDQIHETILHELQHHLEHLASEDTLGDFDYAVEENFRRLEGEAFDPLFYRAGEQVAEDTYRVDEDVFVELRTRSKDAVDYVLNWSGERYQLAIPKSEADVLYAVLAEEMNGVTGDLCVVRIRQRSTLGTLRAGFKGQSVEEILVPVQTHR